MTVLFLLSDDGANDDDSGAASGESKWRCGCGGSAVQCVGPSCTPEWLSTNAAQCGKRKEGREKGGRKEGARREKEGGGRRSLRLISFPFLFGMKVLLAPLEAKFSPMVARLNVTTSRTRMRSSSSTPMCVNVPMLKNQ